MGGPTRSISNVLAMVGASSAAQRILVVLALNAPLHQQLVVVSEARHEVVSRDLLLARMIITPKGLWIKSAIVL